MNLKKDSINQENSHLKEIKKLAIIMCTQPVVFDYNLKKIYENNYKITISEVLIEYSRKFTLENKEIIHYFKDQKFNIINSVKKIYFINITDTLSHLEYFLVCIEYRYTSMKIYKLLGFGKSNNNFVRKKILKYYKNDVENNYLKHIEKSNYLKIYIKKYKRKIHLYFRKNKKIDNFNKLTYYKIINY